MSVGLIALLDDVAGLAQLAAASPSLGPRIASIVLPAILLMEVLGAILATICIHRARETSQPDPTTGVAPSGAVRA